MDIGISVQIDDQCGEERMQDHGDVDRRVDGAFCKAEDERQAPWFLAEGVC